jgi:hypothetical protein
MKKYVSNIGLFRRVQLNLKSQIDIILETI